MSYPPRTCVTDSSPTSASASTRIGPRSTPRQPRPPHVQDRTEKPLLPPWQRRGHLHVDRTRLRHKLTIDTTKMINTSTRLMPLLSARQSAMSSRRSGPHDRSPHPEVMAR